MGRIDRIDQCDLADKGILLFREELASRPMENDGLGVIVALVYYIQLHWLWFRRKDMQRLPLNA